jgi:hypothetical protein
MTELVDPTSDQDRYGGRQVIPAVTARARGHLRHSGSLSLIRCRTEWPTDWFVNDGPRPSEGRIRTLNPFRKCAPIHVHQKQAEIRGANSDDMTHLVTRRMNSPAGRVFGSVRDSLKQVMSPDGDLYYNKSAVSMHA